MHQYLQHYQQQQGHKDPVDIISRALAAKNEANMACTCDISHKYTEAVEHYDKAVHLIDELLTRIPVGNNTATEASVQRIWDEIVSLRKKYSDRMEHIREKLTEAHTSARLRAEQQQHGDHASGHHHHQHHGHNQHSHHASGAPTQRRQPRRMSRVTLDMTSDPSSPATKPWEEPPTLPARHPFWLMRLIRTSILTGGFLTEDIFMPKQVWAQIGVKFYALGSKVSAFEDIMQLLNDRIAPIQFPTEVYAIDHALAVFELLLRELVGIQNALSKPFPFIPEVPLAPTSPAAASPGAASQVGRLAGLFSAVGRNVVKYAEVGYQRIGSAITPKVSHNEFIRYVARTSELCDKIQILDKWIAFVESEKLNLKAEGNTLKQRSETNGNSSGVVMGTSDIDLLSNNRHRTGSNSSIGSSSSNSVSAHSAPSSSVSAMDDTEGQFSLYRHAAEASHGTSELPNNLLPVRSRGAEAINMHFARIDNLSGLLYRIAAFVQHVVCEILLRDVEYLHCRYLRKMRRSMSRMYWDDEDKVSADRGGVSSGSGSGSGNGNHSSNATPFSTAVTGGASDNLQDKSTDGRAIDHHHQNQNQHHHLQHDSSDNFNFAAMQFTE